MIYATKRRCGKEKKSALIRQIRVIRVIRVPINAIRDGRSIEIITLLRQSSTKILWNKMQYKHRSLTQFTLQINITAHRRFYSLIDFLLV